MEIETLFELYKRERDYEDLVFGDYKSNPALSFSSFIILVDEYVRRIKESYCGTWTDESQLPSWVNELDEIKKVSSAPVKSYEYLVKLFVLAGAALETYTDINPLEWRKEGVKDKWKL